MDNKRKLSFVSGAALAFFAAGIIHAAPLAQNLDLNAGVLVAEDEGDAGYDKKREKHHAEDNLKIKKRIKRTKVVHKVEDDATHEESEAHNTSESHKEKEAESGGDHKGDQKGDHYNKKDGEY